MMPENKVRLATYLRDSKDPDVLWLARMAERSHADAVYHQGRMLRLNEATSRANNAAEARNTTISRLAQENSELHGENKRLRGELKGDRENMWRAVRLLKVHEKMSCRLANDLMQAGLAECESLREQIRGLKDRLYASTGDDANWHLEPDELKL